MSKFDTVINNLRHHIFCLKEVHGFKDPHAFDDYETAIRLLEAAGRYAQNPCNDTVADLIDEVRKNEQV